SSGAPGERVISSDIVTRLITKRSTFTWPTTSSGVMLVRTTGEWPLVQRGVLPAAHTRPTGATGPASPLPNPDRAWLGPLKPPASATAATAKPPATPTTATLRRRKRRRLNSGKRPLVLIRL